MRPQTNNCFAAHCPVRLGDGDPATMWIQDEKYGWTAALNRWFCPQHMAAWKTIYRDLELAVLTFHGLALMLAAAPPHLQMQYFEGCRVAAAHLGALRERERDLRGE